MEHGFCVGYGVSVPVALPDRSLGTGPCIGTEDKWPLAVGRSHNRQAREKQGKLGVRSPCDVNRVVLEATGRIHRGVHQSLHDRDQPVAGPPLRRGNGSS